MTDYWSKPYPRRDVKETPVIGGVPVAPPVVMTPETPKPQTTPTIGPYDSFPRPPPQAEWTMLPLGKHKIVSNSSLFFQTNPNKPFRGFYLYLQAKHARYLFLEEYQVGGYSCMCGWAMPGLPLSMFRRLVPWTTPTANVGNRISFLVRNESAFTTEVAGGILGWTLKEGVKVRGNYSSYIDDMT